MDSIVNTSHHAVTVEDTVNRTDARFAGVMENGVGSGLPVQIKCWWCRRRWSSNNQWRGMGHLGQHVLGVSSLDFIGHGCWLCWRLGWFGRLCWPRSFVVGVGVFVYGGVGVHVMVVVPLGFTKVVPQVNSVVSTNTWTWFC